MKRFLIIENIHREYEDGEVISFRDVVCSFSSYEEAEAWLVENGTFRHEIEIHREHGVPHPYYDFHEEDFGENW